MQKYTIEQKNNVIALYKAGISRKNISIQTGVGLETVHAQIKKFRRAGIDVPAPRSHGGNPAGKRVDHEAIIALYKAGFNLNKISESLKVGKVTISKDIAAFRAANPGFKTPKAFARFERDKRICELRKAGNTYAEIAKKVELSEPGVCAVCSKYGLTHAAKQARKNNGEIPQELLTPLLEYMRKFISAELAEKVQALVKEIA